jgi:hypothetical protein
MALKPLPKLKLKAWRLLSECVRREAANADGYVYCYTCDRPLPWKEAQAGHGIGGRTGATLLDESIIRPQCYRCNVPMRGEYGLFAVRLDAENGTGWYERKVLESRAVKKWSRTDLDAKIEEYERRLKSAKQRNT